MTLCFKTAYATAAAAYRAMHRIQRRHARSREHNVEKKVYRCKTCHVWHLTSSDQEKWG